MSAPPPTVEQLPSGSADNNNTSGFTVGGSGPVKQLSSNNKTGSGTFDVGAFVAAQNAPLVVIKYEADFCHQCKTIAPLFERLATAGAPAIACFTADVGENEDIGEASGIQNLPTFKFFTTKLSPTGELLCIDGLEGANAQSLQQKFSKALEVVASIRSQAPPRQQQAPPPIQPPRQQPQAAAARQPAPLHPQFPDYPPQQARLTQQQQLKKELIDIRTVLLATVQRVEHMYQMLQ